MKTRRSITRILLLAVLLVSASCRGVGESRAERLGFDETRLEAIGGVVEKHVDAQKIAGGVVLVARRGEVVYLSALGYLDVDGRVPMQPDSIFRIASMTKPVTSVAAMVLVEDGTLALDDPISKFLPEFAKPSILVESGSGNGEQPQYDVVPGHTEITVRHLLTHTSGLVYRSLGHEYLAPRYAEDGVAGGLAETEGTAGDNARRLAKSPLLFEPGTDWAYSMSTDVLGAVIEAASGKTLDDVFSERILEPLGMRDTHFILPREKRGRITTVYASSESDSISPLPTDGPVVATHIVYSQTYPYDHSGTFFSGGAGLVSTARDYFRFAQMLLDGGQLDGVRILKAETVEQMTSNQIGDIDPVLSRFAGYGGEFGLGFGIVSEVEGAEARCAPGSFGWGGFFNTDFWVDPEHELVAVLMTQLFPNDHLKTRVEFRERVYDALRHAAPVE